MTKAIDSRASGQEFTELMERFGLRSTDGAAFAGELIRRDPRTIMTFYSRGLDRNDYELLEYKLDEWTVKVSAPKRTKR